MPDQKQLWALVGAKGAGKSTFFRHYLEPQGLPCISPGDLPRQWHSMLPLDPQQEADALIDDALSRGLNFCLETDLTGTETIDALGRAKAIGYQIVLALVHLESVSLHRARASQRVGRQAPAFKVASTIPQMLANAGRVIPLCDEACLLDNSRSDKPFDFIARFRHGRLEQTASAIPGWAADLVS